MPANRNIRDKYREIIQALAKKHGAVVAGFEISKNAELDTCLGYTMKYIVKGDRQHYRYDRYYRSLKFLLRRYPVKRGSIIHVDLGCGPGLFTWVVSDYFRSQSKIEVSSYGYDHAPNMVRLARLIWKRLELNENYSCQHKLDKLILSIRERKYENLSYLITFGHVLIQTRDDHKALENFADIVGNCVNTAECRMVAVDATMYDRPAKFREGCERLVVAMEKKGLIVDNPHIVESEMWTVARMRHQA